MSRLNIADGLNPIVNEYSKDIFIKMIHEYLNNSNDRCEYISKKQNRKTTEYCTTIMSFDIESTSLYVKNEKKVIPYIWQIAIQDYVFYGRHFKDIVEMFDTLSEIFNTNENRHIIVWCHNLSYEFQFIRKYFKWIEVFSLDERQPIKAVTNKGVDFRCSYALSGMNLDNLAKKGIHQGKVQKMVGDLDYNLIRHEKTPLTPEELKYCYNDVLVVVEYITEQVNEIYGDITNLPMTKTGAVRQEVRNKTIREHDDKYSHKKYQDLINKLTISVEEYKALTEVFQGGFTHANPLYVRDTLYNVGTADINSAYPAVICTEQFPMSKGVKITINNDWDKYNKLEESGLMHFICKIYGVKPKHEFEHILQSSKCSGTKKLKVDNNRVISADELVTRMTSVDLREFFKFYDFDNIAIGDVWYYDKDYLPRDLVLAILDLFSKKTELKGVKGKELLYSLKKSNLNSVYGMMVMSVIREVITYTEDGVFEPKMPKDEDAIEEYNKSKSRFLYYPWGVFVTSYARKRLQDFILMTAEDHVYSDTDSDKFLNPEEHIKDIESFNKAIDIKILQASEALNIDLDLFYPKTIDGEVQALGHIDYEGIYDKFKTLGAKRYLVERTDKKGVKSIELTCAGVNKKKGIEYIKKQKKDPFTLFDDGLFIPKKYSGKMVSTYLDEDMEFDCIDYNGDKDHCIVKSGTHLEQTHFSLSIEIRFKSFLKSIENRKQIRRM